MYGPRPGSGVVLVVPYLFDMLVLLFIVFDLVTRVDFGFESHNLVDNFHFVRWMWQAVKWTYFMLFVGYPSFAADHPHRRLF